MAGTTTRPRYPDWPGEYADRYRAEGLWRDETLCDVLSARAAEHGDRLALVAGETRLSYGDLAARVDRLAAGLQRTGIRRGDHVVVQLPNGAEFVETFFALLRLGAIAVLALPAHRRTEIAQFCAHTDAVAYIVADKHLGFDYRGLAAEISADLPRLRHVIVAGEPGRVGESHGFQRLDALYPPVDAGTAADALPSPPAASDVALLQLSGGSTGVPKLIPRRHEDYLCAIRESLDACPLDARSVFLGALPVAHNFPFVSPGILGAFHAGATVVLAHVPSPDVVFALIEAERVTITSAVPPLALTWLAAAASTDRDLSSLEVLQIGGAACGTELARRVGPELGATVQQVFGMAEGLINYTRLDDPQDVLVGTQGRPCSAADEIRIVDDAGSPVPQGSPGQLLTRGPYTVRGYFEPVRGDGGAADPSVPGSGSPADPNLTSFTDDGFYRTGDLAVLRPDGNLVVVGRAKEQINRGGEKISPDEVEGRLLAHPGIHDAAVVAVPDDALGERTCAFVIPRHGAPEPSQEDGTPPLAPRDVTRYLRRDGLAAYKIPDLVEIVDEFPVIGVGKISRAQLRRALAESRAAG
ncbi:(2,3-dihydroxybenzoyl)adenylate synthase [Tomitella fengzijianii]|uniref:AMP-binding protein n=1 Tax=Tomitella fengzijianii TaxID=2597660 RepID=A0A516X5R1_9ACTN|nr:AMP-binding protein [Tomitella fengzijianii]QDQ98412.1 AMP-binding protein [Tomitella fengzijianii]